LYQVKWEKLSKKGQIYITEDRKYSLKLLLAYYYYYIGVLAVDAAHKIKN
jgi:hypothetical protein